MNDMNLAARVAALEKSMEESFKRDTKILVNSEKIKELSQKIGKLEETVRYNAQNVMNRNEIMDKIEAVLRELLDKYTEYEDQSIHRSFYKRLLEKLITDNPTLGDGIPEDARFPATDRVDGEQVDEERDKMIRGTDHVLEMDLAKEKEPPFICPECNVEMDYATTTTTGDDPEETYYQCFNCLRIFPEWFLKEKEPPVDFSPHPEVLLRFQIPVSSPLTVFHVRFPAVSFLFS